jgi:hypothetical protein
MYIMLQQLIHQNLLYYTIIIILKSDHEIDFMIFSYFMKCMLKNCFKFMKHVDFNILDLLSDKEQNYIQEFVIFAKELNKSENEIILNMHY